jgi:hypothetical protein
MRFEELDIETLKHIGKDETTAQAQSLVQGRRIQNLYRLPNRLLGTVKDGETVQVEVKIQDDQLSYVCSCPQVEGGEVCSHVLALLWAWVEEPARFLNQGELKDRLKKYSKKELVDIILEMAESTPDVRAILKEEDQGLEDILESIDRVVEGTPSDSPTLAEAESKLRQAQIRADRLAQSGNLAEARSIYFYLLDNILSLEERLQKAFPPELKKELFEEYCQFIHEDRHLEKELVQQEIEQLESRSPVFRSELDLSEIKRELNLAG